jgi:hypothetical protein
VIGRAARLLGVTAIIAAAAGTAGRARAESVVVGAGQTLVLDHDVTIAAGETLQAVGTAAAPCQIVGAGHKITGTALTGQPAIGFCTLSGLGGPNLRALDLDAGDGSALRITDTTFDACGTVRVQTDGSATAEVARNVFSANGTMAVVKTSLDQSEPAFLAEGQGTGQKTFKSNKVFLSWIDFGGVLDWDVGGNSAAEGNLIVGQRGGINVRGSHINVRGNYVRASQPLDGWNQVATMNANGDNIVVENNVLRGGNWIVRTFNGGELRYNLIGDAHAVSFVITSTDGQARIHHNVMYAMGAQDPALEGGNPDRIDGIEVLYNGTASTEVFNNTLDGGNCWPPMGSAVNITSGAVLKSLRSNVFAEFSTDLGASSAAIGLGRDGNGQLLPKTDPPPIGLGYADYNDFYNMMAAAIDNYANGVAGKRERLDAGFALNDLHAGGTVDEQVDPVFAGPISRRFPYDEVDDIVSGRVTVCQILAYFRNVYAPGPGSPLIDAGDPADGAATDIGAIEAGTSRAEDLFGRLCPPSESIPPPPTVAPVSRCVVALGAGDYTGGTTPPVGDNGPRQLMCVCQLSGAPRPGELAVMAAGLALVLARRGRAGRR